jgi:hypothetical protein
VDDDDDDFDDRPRKKFKAKKKKGSNAGLVIALVAVGVVVVLGGAGFGLYFLLSGGGADDPMAYVPANSTMVIGVDGAAILNSSFGPKIEELLNNPALAPLAKYKQDTKSTNKELFQRIVVAAQGSGPGAKPVIAVKSSVPWDDAKLAAALDYPTKTTAGGRTVYHRKAGAPPSGPAAVSVPHKNVAVFTDLGDTELEPILKAKGSAVKGDLGTVLDKASKGTIFIAVAMEGNVRQQVQGAMAMAGPAAKSIGAGLQSAKAFGFWATLESADLEIKMGVLMPDTSAAEKLVADMKAEAQKSANDPAAKMMMAMMPAAFKALMQEATETQQFSTEGSMALVSARLRTATLDNAISDTTKMLGAFGGPAGQPPANTQPPPATTRSPRRGAIPGRP